MVQRGALQLAGAAGVLARELDSCSVPPRATFDLSFPALSTVSNDTCLKLLRFRSLALQVPERLVARRACPHAPGWEVLVKWTGLGYEHATWEVCSTLRTLSMLCKLGLLDGECWPVLPGRAAASEGHSSALQGAIVMRACRLRPSPTPSRLAWPPRSLRTRATWRSPSLCSYTGHCGTGSTRRWRGAPRSGSLRELLRAAQRGPCSAALL